MLIFYWVAEWVEAHLQGGRCSRDRGMPSPAGVLCCAPRTRLGPGEKCAVCFGFF